MEADQLLLGIVWYVALIFSLTFHEAAHALAAQRGGDPTAYLGGQVSLDPRPHMRREPFGTVFVPLLSFAMAGWMIGWASTPYDPHWADRHPRRAAWMSLAGPAANLLLVVAAGIAIRLGILAGVLHAPESIRFAEVVAASSGGVWPTVAALLSVLFTLNLLLCVFNLLPAPPLDGATGVGVFLDDAGARRLRQRMANPRIALLGLFLAWFLIGPVFRPVHRIAIALLYPEYAYG